jgi:acetyl-CoA carboxylase biotin carboxyl carrier protein
MDFRQVKKLIDLLQCSDIDEIEVKEGENSIRVCRHRSPVASQYSLSESMPTQGAHSTKTNPLTPSASIEKSSAALPESAPPLGHIVRSPMVGVFYRSNAPDAPPFVEENGLIKAGDPLCIIEAMKMMNHIEADRSGKITTIFVENGTPVEFDQPLFVIT